MKGFGLFAIAMLVATPTYAAESPVAGSWQTQAETPGGPVAAVLVFKPSVTGFDVTIDEQGVESSISDVKVEGANFSFKREVAFPGGSVRLTYTGSVSGDNLTATGKGDGVEIRMTGKHD